ncbi:MAG: aquaporin family protein [Bacteroidales bacterium]|nr:aquaporin family protein [Bacteroidales bacterium]MCR5277008.1 aquaporin family protein [Bacteroidales bacterium]
MEKYLFEFIGTLILVLLGDGVCAATSLNHSKAKGAGWVVIALGWGLAVMMGVLVAGPVSGAHLNPAVTLGLAVAGSFPWADVCGYIVGQMLGGFLGACLVWVFYKDHYKATADQPDTILGTFCTMPAIPNAWRNFLCEVIATCLLVFVILALATEGNAFQVGPVSASTGAIGSWPVTCLIMAIGMSLGGTTGYALNPARDLSPRCAHAVLPIAGKRDSGWGYSWIPVAGPMAGAALAAALYLLVF